MIRYVMKAVMACAFALQAMLPGVAWSAATASVPVMDNIGTPRFAKEGGAVPLPGTRTIPYFTFNQMDPTNHVTYPITYVGASPLLESRTVVPAVVIPITLRFDNGVVLNGVPRATQVLASPIFQSFDYSGPIGVPDVGQYGDVFMRAQANKLGTGYHVELGTPVVLPAVTIDVPKNHGFGAQSRATGAFLGLVDIVWYSARLQNLIASLQIDPTTLPMFITDNAFLYIGDPGNCCVLGYHGAGHPTGYGAGNVNSNGNAPIQTYLWASLNTQGIFSAPFIADIHGLSHEVAEWLDDPFINNLVQPWLTPTAPQYGCTSYLETGDPVVGIGFNLGPWHPEDEVFGQWFLRESPSSAFEGRYTFMGFPRNPYPGFNAPATGC